MKTETLDTFPVGVAVGAASALMGYLILGILWGAVQGESLRFFHEEMFLGSPLFKDRILSVCTLCIVPAFHLAYKRRMDRFARGTLLVMIAIVMAIVWLQMDAQ